jgi:hypothetical protein
MTLRILNGSGAGELAGMSGDAFIFTYELL